mgnify:CR=1 FL=1
MDDADHKGDEKSKNSKAALEAAALAYHERAPAGKIFTGLGNAPASC